MMSNDGQFVDNQNYEINGFYSSDGFYESGSTQQQPEYYNFEQNNQQSFYNPSNSTNHFNPNVQQVDEAHGDFDDEPPLLEELGINFDHIWLKTVSVLNPISETDSHIMDDTDLAGPFIFCLAFAGLLLLHGKLQFGYIYGFSLLGCVAMYSILNLMSFTSLSIWCTVSVLGYCLLPMTFLSGLALIVPLNGIVGGLVTALVIGWCSLASSKLFVTVLAMDSQQMLVAYPCALLYGVFALLTVF